jgi:hypothetical protein
MNHLPSRLADEGQRPHGGTYFCGGGRQKAVLRPYGRLVLRHNFNSQTVLMKA